MGIRVDFNLVKYNGEKLNSVEKYEIEKELNINLSKYLDQLVKETLPSYIKCKGCSHKLVSHNKHIVEILK